jgi:hypothetical protein
MDSTKQNTIQSDIGSGNPAETRNIIRELRDQAFDSSDEMLALALGRPIDQVRTLVAGTEDADDDIAMKVRGIAEERGVTLPETI